MGLPFLFWFCTITAMIILTNIVLHKTRNKKARTWILGILYSLFIITVITKNDTLFGVYFIGSMIIVWGYVTRGVEFPPVSNEELYDPPRKHIYINGQQANRRSDGKWDFYQDDGWHVVEEDESGVLYDTYDGTEYHHTLNGNYRDYDH